MTTPLLAPYDALVLLSFGGPEKPDDVLPFLQNVTAGKQVPPERLADVGRHYHLFGGRSPINDQNRDLLDALRAELAARGSGTPVYWGNRNWEPYLLDALRQAHDDGAGRVLVVTTSAYASYSGCRQYREDVASALLALAAEGRALSADKVRHYFNHPGFVTACTDAVVEALDGLGTSSADARLVFVTHAIPTAMAETAGPDGGAYVAQHLDVAATVSAEVERQTGVHRGHDLVYCSRSGPPGQPWTEPDVGDHLAELARRGESAVACVPIGFVSDHMEVVHDLDTEGAAAASAAGLAWARAATAGTHLAFVAGLADLVVERAAVARSHDVPRPAAGELGPSHDVCPAGCCPNPRSDKPAACGADWVDPLVDRTAAR